MARLVRNLSLLLLLLALTGGPWALLQTAAWAGMLVDHLHNQSLALAVAQTFDGHHPCAMCKAIQRQQSPEKKSDFDLKPIRMDLLIAGNIEIVPNDRCDRLIVILDEFAPSLARPPLLRPPRPVRL